MRLAAGLPPSGSAPRMRLCMVVHAYYPLAETRVEREAARPSGRCRRLSRTTDNSGALSFRRDLPRNKHTALGT